MLEKSPREEKLGCLFGLVVGLVGFLLVRQASAEIDTVCGLPVVVTIFGGLFLGGLVGTLFGMILSHLIPENFPMLSNDEKLSTSSAVTGWAGVVLGLSMMAASLFGEIGAIGKTDFPLASFGFALLVGGYILCRVLAPIHSRIDQLEQRLAESRFGVKAPSSSTTDGHDGEPEANV